MFSFFINFILLRKIVPRVGVAPRTSDFQLQGIRKVAKKGLPERSLKVKAN